MKAYSPSDVAEFSGINADLQRDWRRRGFLDDYGSQSEAGRWTYRVGDVVALAVAKRILDRRIVASVGDALRIANFANALIWHWLEPKNSTDLVQSGFRQTDFVVAYYAHGTIQLHAASATTLTTNKGSIVGEGAIVINTRQMAEALRAQLWMVIARYMVPMHGDGE